VELTIRRAVPSETAQLREIAIASKRYWGYPDDWMARWAELIAIPPAYLERNEVYVAELQGQTIGFLALVLRDRECELDHLWLLPEHIGKGLGRRLFEHARDRAKELGAVRLVLEAEPPAAGFYERMGARRIGENLTAMGRLAPIMHLELDGR
jgi:GNAT superfamily N-acetyltransferase